MRGPNLVIFMEQKVNVFLGLGSIKTEVRGYDMRILSEVMKIF